MSKYSRRVHMLLLLLAVGAGAGAAACANQQRPSDPSPFEGALTGVVVERLPDGSDGPPVVGASVQIVATGGPGQTAITNDQGAYRLDLVSGAFQLRASKSDYEATTASVGPFKADSNVKLAIAPIPHTLSGYVTETAPTESVPIADATVEILTGANKGRTAITDAAGQFAFSNVWGEFEVAMSKSGYDTRAFRVTLAAANARFDTSLAPWRREIRDVFSLPTGSPPVREAIFSIPVHHSGTWRTELRICGFNCLASPMRNLCAELRDGSNRLVARDHGMYDFSPWPLPFSIDVTGGQTYQVKLFACAELPSWDPGGDWDIVSYLLTVTHPN